VQRRDAAMGSWSDVAGAGTLAGPVAVAADAGALYVADGDRVLRVSAAATSAVAPPSGAFAAPGGLALAGPYLYVSDTGHDRVVRQDRRTGEWVSLGGEGNDLGSFLGPLGIAAGAAGDPVYVADQLNDRIERFGVPPRRAATVAAAPPAAHANVAPAPFRLRVRV